MPDQTRHGPRSPRAWPGLAWPGRGRCCVLAVTTTARQYGGRFVGSGPRIVRQAQRYVQHVIALRVPVAGDILAVQAGPTDFAELTAP
ncbi:hypothetical protein [Actinomadura sp. WMMB 499]|uniref:hypothetical protein n=1 Tax=Actinomadura sp. WMMB 499 TaxID=1219491 RepID=UPI00124465A6|nr:hypothetical protein [Actinomadura sp. WMMB 499]QFG22189.1 hypothetical protein F7P10_14700 [Actinomadura sp. WMMB 499]